MRRQCDSCYCTAQAHSRTCVACTRAPPRHVSALEIEDDDGTTCVTCRNLLCPLHTSPQQRAARKCGECGSTSRPLYLAFHDADDVSVESVRSMEVDEDSVLYSESGFMQWLMTQPEQPDDVLNAPLSVRPPLTAAFTTVTTPSTHACAICLEGACDAVMHCHPSHTFHVQCITQWFTAQRQTFTCPLCRIDPVAAAPVECPA